MISTKTITKTKKLPRATPQNSKREYPQRQQHHNQWQTNEEKRWYNQRNTQHTSDRPHQNNHPKQIHQQITVVPEHPGENKQGISNERAL